MVRVPLPRGVRKAIERLEAEPARRWRLGDLAAACGIAPRTLQKQFRRFLGRAPLEFLRELRFDRARRDLLHASETATITEIATRCGFAHFGRFATEYHRRYGETPSTPLRRSRRLSLPSAASPPLRSHARAARDCDPSLRLRRPAAGARRRCMKKLRSRSGAHAGSTSRRPRMRAITWRARSARMTEVVSASWSSCSTRSPAAISGLQALTEKRTTRSDLEERIAIGVLRAIQPAEYGIEHTVLSKKRTRCRCLSQQSQFKTRSPKRLNIY